MIQQIKQSTVTCLYMTDGDDKKYKRKRKKVQSACVSLKVVPFGRSCMVSY